MSDNELWKAYGHVVTNPKYLTDKEQAHTMLILNGETYYLNWLGAVAFKAAQMWRDIKVELDGRGTE